MSRKHVHDRIDRLARRLADAEAELAALRAWKDSHACAPQSYQPVPIPPAQACTCGATGGWCPQHGTRWQQPFIWSGDPHISTVTIPAGQWTAINTAGAAPVASTFTYSHPAPLRQVWPPKNPPDDPDMGVPAIV